MRTIAKTVLVLSLIGGAATLAIPGAGSAQAQGFYFDVPGVHVRVGHPHHRYYRHRYYRDYDRGYDAYDYAGPRRGGGWSTYNGCPPYYTIQDGVCKPYRGY